MGEDISQLRQRLRKAGEQTWRHLKLLLGERGPLIRGSFGIRARVCGNPNCRCASGNLHESKYLTASDGGKARQVHVPAADEVAVAAGVHRYRRFYGARADLAETARLQLELVDALGRMLLKPYPDENPLPPAKHCGRPPGRVGGKR
jgi:hypothetical protein